MNVLPFEKQVQIISALTEGCSIRSTERMTGVHRDSVMRLGRVGQGCENVHNRYMRDLQVNLIELDKQWDFIQKEAETGPDKAIRRVWGTCGCSWRWRPPKRPCSAIW